MAQGNKKTKYASSKKQPSTGGVAGRKHIKAIDASGGTKYMIPLFIIVIISFLVYLPALNGTFVWDDGGYIKEDPLIHSINLKEIFSTYIMGNYHPLTMLVYAIEYHVFGLSEKGYHVVNILIHLMNVILVFYVVLYLSEKSEIALVASLLFGIHPMHVESVAWVAELKDVLYAFFFLASYLFYLKYLRDPQQRKLYMYCLLLFLLSLFSKGMAASLPPLLLLTDYFKGRKITTKVLLEKVPFFALSLIFGVVAVFAQRSTEALEVVTFALPQRIIFASYGFITYLVKFILPLHLSAFYPYPIKNGQAVPSVYYIYPVLLAGLFIGLFYLLRFSRKTLFGVGFFAITIVLVLQLLAVGSTIMSDRYSYIPSIGIFYLAGEGFYWLWNKAKSSAGLKLPLIALSVVILLFFSVKTYAKCAVWENGMTLWTDVISQHPTISIAYYNRGVSLKDEQRFDEALTDFSKAIELQPLYVTAYNDRGIILGMRKKYDEAIRDFNKSIELKPFDNSEAYCDRAITLDNINRHEEALKDYDKAIEENPKFALAYYNRATIEYNSGKKDMACPDFQQALNLNFPLAQDAYNRLCR